jgi:hypothetical protein
MPSSVVAAAGRVLRGVFAAVLRVRRPRPIHARGIVLTGELRFRGARPRTGLSWIDDAEAAPSRVTARLSRSVGLPAVLPDVWGLALRVGTGGPPADIELSTTGIGVPGRFLLQPRRSPGRGAVYSAILPYRTPAGPLLLAALADVHRMLAADVAEVAEELATSPWRLRLCAARPGGRWHPVADVELRTAEDQDDRRLRFDAVERPLPGADAYEWVRQLRQPSYRLARRS